MSGLSASAASRDAFRTTRSSSQWKPSHRQDEPCASTSLPQPGPAKPPRGQRLTLRIAPSRGRLERHDGDVRSDQPLRPHLERQPALGLLVREVLLPPLPNRPSSEHHRLVAHHEVRVRCEELRESRGIVGVPCGQIGFGTRPKGIPARSPTACASTMPGLATRNRSVASVVTHAPTARTGPCFDDVPGSPLMRDGPLSATRRARPRPRLAGAPEESVLTVQFVEETAEVRRRLI